MTSSVQVLEAFWACPYCGATARKWRRQKIARKVARGHLSRYHREERKTNPKYPIIEIRRKEDARD